MQGSSSSGESEAVLKLESEEQSFTFTEVPEQPVLSALRGFSAPVKLSVAGQSEADLVFLLGHDTDAFSKWEASQSLQRNLLVKLYHAAKDGSEVRDRPF